MLMSSEHTPTCTKSAPKGLKEKNRSKERTGKSNYVYKNTLYMSGCSFL